MLKHPQTGRSLTGGLRPPSLGEALEPLTPPPQDGAPPRPGHSLLLEDGLDALALVGAEGDAGLRGAQHPVHLPLLVVLLHGDLRRQSEQRESGYGSPRGFSIFMFLMKLLLYNLF